MLRAAMEIDVTHTAASLRGLYHTIWRERVGAWYRLAWGLAFALMLYMMLTSSAPWHAVAGFTACILYVTAMRSARQTAAEIAAQLPAGAREFIEARVAATRPRA